jgi:hypothetical protein
LIKEAIHQEELVILNIYKLNVSAPNFIKETQLNIKAQIDLNTIIVGECNTPLSPIDRSCRQKNQEGTLGIN